jgi:hypothetical protein
MKLRGLFFGFLFSLAAFQFCFSQEQEKNFVLFDSFSETTYEELIARIDYLAVETNKTPNAVGYIVIYGGSNPIENAFNRKSIQNYIKFRKFDEKYLSVINSSDLEKPKLEFWISKDGTKPKVKEEKPSFSLPKTNKAILFIDDAIEIVKIDERQTYLPFGCDAGCVTYVNFYLLSEFLNSNPDIKAYVIIHEKNLKKAKKVMKILSKETSDEVKISPDRIKFLYGGKNRISGNNSSEIQIYLGTGESQLPKTSSKKYKTFN